MNGQPPDFAAWMAMKRQAPEFPAGGAVMANPGLLPPGSVVYEDGSYRSPVPEIPLYPPGLAFGRAPNVPWTGDGVPGLLPGLFGHAPGAFVPYPEG